jgi:predicted RNA-binding Zn-ribbon protein involved in translation (DUF1610 family)
MITHQPEKFITQCDTCRASVTSGDRDFPATWQTWIMRAGVEQVVHHLCPTCATRMTGLIQPDVRRTSRGDAL